MSLISDQASSDGELMRRLRELEHRLTEVENARALERSSIGAGGLTVKGGAIAILDAAGNETMRLSTDGLTLQGLLAVAGSIEVSGGTIVIDGGDLRSSDYDPGVAGFLFGDDVELNDATVRGTIEALAGILGNLTVTGEVVSDNYDPDTAGYRLTSSLFEVNQIQVRQGIIGMEDLADPVSAATGENSVTVGSNLPSSMSNLTSVTLNVPSWATRAVVTADVGLTAHMPNTTGTYAAVFTQARIAGGDGTSMATSLYAPGTGDTDDQFVGAAHGRTLTSLGSTITCNVRGYRQSGNVSAYRAYVRATAIFERP